MTEQEAERMASYISRILKDVPVCVHQSETGVWSVRVVWSVGSIYMVSVRECMRNAAYWKAHGVA